jgi:NADH dehydrogenase
MNLVVGATGLVGGEICRLLAEAGRPVRALVRPGTGADAIARLRDLGAEIAQGDLKDRGSIDAACRNAATAISTASSTLRRQAGDSIESVDHQGQLDLVAAAEAAGVGQFVLVSFPPIDLEFPLQSAKRAVEQRLARARMTYTVLQPTCFMEIWLSPALGFDPSHGTATVYGDGHNKVSWISFLDVARFAVAALGNSRAVRATFRLGGPDALSPLEVVHLAEKIAKKPIVIQHAPEDALQAQYEAAADPLQRSMAALMLYCARGDAIDTRQSLDALAVPRLKSVRNHLTGFASAAGSMLPGS